MLNTQIDMSPIVLIGNDGTLNINEYGIFNKIKIADEITLLQNEYLDIIETNNLEIDGVKFQFTDNKWDFTSRQMKGKDKDSYTYIFDIPSLSSDYYVTITKLFVLSNILENGLHFTSLHTKFNVISKFTNYLINNDCFKIESLSLNKLQEFIHFLDLNYRTEVKYQTYIREYISFYSLVTGIIIDNDIFDYLNEVDGNKLKTVQKLGKRKLLPQAFMSELKDILYSEATNQNSNTKKIQKSGLLFICTQTGLRVGELLMLKKDCIETKEVDGITISYLNYQSIKNVQGGGYTDGRTVANDKVVKVVNILKNLADKDSNYLAPNTFKNTTLNNALRNICISNTNKLNNITDEPDESFNGKPEIIETNGKKQYINIPICVQFRVYFATEMTQRGFSELLIAKLLNHKDEKMFNYYARPVTSIQEDPNFSKMVVKDAIVNDYKILGPNGEVFKKEMEEFINNKDVNVKQNIDKIIEDILKNMPIRRKFGGYCIKSNPARACQHDAPTDEFYCAYGLCQNQCHFFYHCIYYFNEMREGEKLVQFNLKKGYKQQAQKELYKLQSIINTKMIPELEELQKELIIKGRDELINQFCDLEYIIDNLESIIKEVKEWKLKKL